MGVKTGARAHVRARREARILALQVLYETDTAQHPAGEVLQRHLHERADGADGGARQYAIQLVSGVLQDRAALDAVLSDCAPDFPLADLSPIDRNVLRIGLYEIHAGLAPVKVAVNEAIEIAKQFGSDTSPRFVNGVLGNAASRLRPSGGAA